MEIGANSAFNSSLQGFQAAQNRANEAAQNIASQSVTDASTNGVNSDEIVTSLVKLNAAENDARANANVIESASEVLGTLLDIEV